MVRVQYLNSLPGKDKKLGCVVVKDGIYECSEIVAQTLIKTGQYKLVEEENKTIIEETVVKKVKNKKQLGDE